VIARQRHVDPLIPQVDPIAFVCDRLAGQERYIRLVPLNRSNMIARPALDEIRANARIPSHVGAKQVGEETRCERREYADAHNAGFAAPKRTGVNLGETYLCYCIARSNEELLTCMGEIDPSVMANKKCCSDFVFKVSYASADGRLLNCQRLRRASKATALSSGDNVSQMAQFDRQGTASGWEGSISASNGTTSSAVESCRLTISFPYVRLCRGW